MFGLSNRSKIILVILTCQWKKVHALGIKAGLTICWNLHSSKCNLKDLFLLRFH